MLLRNDDFCNINLFGKFSNLLDQNDLFCFFPRTLSQFGHLCVVAYVLGMQKGMQQKGGTIKHITAAKIHYYSVQDLLVTDITLLLQDGQLRV
jgi:hypothetical protein